jgi:hypothetical protein
VFDVINNFLESAFVDFSDACNEDIPCCKFLNIGFNYKNVNQQPLIFIAQDDSLPFPEMNYEERIFNHGLIATRPHNWHDFFNAMVWKTFPQTKSAINALHQQGILQQSGPMRSRRRDLLTLFDESGVIIIAKKPILELIKNHQWHALFVENKALWLNGSIQIKTFGHALFEKYRSPYIGLTAQALLFDENIVELDGFLSHQLSQNHLLNSKAELSPLPLLGIPQWHENQDDAFYANTQYFR